MVFNWDGVMPNVYLLYSWNAFRPEHTYHCNRLYGCIDCGIQRGVRLLQGQGYRGLVEDAGEGMNDYQRELTVYFFFISMALIFGGCFLFGLSSPPIQTYWNSSPYIDARANMLRNLTMEQVYVYSNGEEIASNLTGTWNQVTIPDFNGNNITILHNHPIQPGLWEGFSYEDLKVAYRNNISKMVLVTANGIWTSYKPFKSVDFKPYR